RIHLKAVGYPADARNMCQSLQNLIDFMPENWAAENDIAILHINVNRAGMAGDHSEFGTDSFGEDLVVDGPVGGQTQFAEQAAKAVGQIPFTLFHTTGELTEVVTILVSDE